MPHCLTDPIGAAWLAQTYGVAPLARLPVLSQVGARRETATTDGLRIETYPQTMRPADEAFAHLQFHLRYEVPHLEFLARLFQKTGPAFVQAWVEREPTGRYARRAAFLYEWLTAQMLEPPARADVVWPAIVDAVAQAMQEGNADMAAIAHFPPK